MCIITGLSVLCTLVLFQDCCYQSRASPVRWWRCNVLTRQRKLDSCDSLGLAGSSDLTKVVSHQPTLRRGGGRDSWKYALPGNRVYFSLLELDITGKMMTTWQNKMSDYTWFIIQPWQAVWLLYFPLRQWHQDCCQALLSCYFTVKQWE